MGLTGMEFKQYRKKVTAEGRPFVQGEALEHNISVSEADRKAGSPKVGDYIFRNPLNHADQWLVAGKFFKENYEPVEVKP